LINERDAILAIYEQRKDEIVVTHMTPGRYWAEISADSLLDIPILGGMGKASSFGLGIALAREEKKVIVLDTDGALLMNLGTLATISEQSPTNFIHFVFQDGRYVTTGGQPVPGGMNIDFSGAAKSMGYKETFYFDDLEVFCQDIKNILTLDGPVFITLVVEHNNEIPGLEVLPVLSTQQAINRTRDLFHK
tara:strand:+ start:122 stop:694 length:573 start_codon:yes stop_codon:yes gene_type:complete